MGQPYCAHTRAANTHAKTLKCVLPDALDAIAEAIGASVSPALTEAEARAEGYIPADEYANRLRIGISTARHALRDGWKAGKLDRVRVHALGMDGSPAYWHRAKREGKA